jgi:hypothetical protein
MKLPQRFRRGAGNRQTVMQRDSQRIARQWNREIEDEVRRDAARDVAEGRWKAVTWTGLWLLWLLLLVALVSNIRALG